LLFDTRITKRELETHQLLCVAADALGEKALLGHEIIAIDHSADSFGPLLSHDPGVSPPLVAELYRHCFARKDNLPKCRLVLQI
jgi:hypothetical protein